MKNQKKCSLNITEVAQALPVKAPVKRYRAAFTLIELLVAVLIIGILAAIAVPKYQVAVQKAQYTKLRTMADSIARSVSVAYLTKGTWQLSFDELDLSLPSNMELVSTTDPQHPNLSYCAQNEEMFCCFSWPRKLYTGGNIGCALRDGSIAYLRGFANEDGVPEHAYSCAQKSNLSFCQHLPNAKKVANAASLMTPTGWTIGGYEYFTFD